MRRPDAYAYALARVYAKRSYMLKAEDFENMARAISYQQALRYLASTSYGPYIASAEEVMDVDRGLAQSYNDLFEELTRLVSGKAKAYIELSKYKHELEVLKAILRAKFSNVPKTEALRLIVPVGRYGPEVCEKLIGARDTSTAIFMVQDEELKGRLHVALKGAEELKSPYPLELAVDRYAYGLLGKAVEELKGLDRDWVRRLLGEEVDLKNFMVCLRLKSMGVKDYKNYLLPYKFRFTVEMASKAMSAPTLSEALTVVKDLWGEVPKATSLTEVEAHLLRRLAKVNAAIFLHYGFHVGILQALLNLKFFEVRNLKALLIGKSEGLPAEDIMSRLILH